MKSEYSIKILNDEERIIKLEQSDRVVLRLDNTVIDVELSITGTPLINLYSYSADKPITGVVINELQNKEG